MTIIETTGATSHAQLHEIKRNLVQPDIKIKCKLKHKMIDKG